MKNTILLIILWLTCSGAVLLAQATNPPPEPWASSTVVPQQNALLVALEVMVFTGPVGNTTDWVGAVDADDASVLLGFGRADVNGLGDFVTSPQVNQPTGASNSFHLVFFDESGQTFHILNDATGSPLTIFWTDDDQNAFVDGYEIGAFGAFPGNGMPSAPGQADFDAIVTFLPVELTLFTGAYQGKQVQLDWSTASEESNDFFAVERSTDGVTFTTIGQVSGKNTASSYAFTDDTPTGGDNYYRLGQTDLDGTVTHSEVVVVFAKTSDAEVGIYPNPTKSTLNLRLDGKWNGQISVTLLDGNGRSVKNWEQSASSMGELILPALAPGLYHVRVADSEHSMMSTLMINQ